MPDQTKALQPFTGRQMAQLRGYSSYASTMEGPAIIKVLASILEIADQQRRALSKDGHAEFLKWVSTALEKGAGVAHRWCSQKSKAPPLPHVVEDGDELLYTPLQKTSHYLKMWKLIWGEHLGEYEKLVKAIRLIKGRARGAASMDRIDGTQVIKAAKTIANGTGLGLDDWEPMWLKAMSMEAAESLASILNEIEDECTWPIHILANLIVLMGKPAGGVRREGDGLPNS